MDAVRKRPQTSPAAKKLKTQHQHANDKAKAGTLTSEVLHTLAPINCLQNIENKSEVADGLDQAHRCILFDQQSFFSPLIA